MFILPPTTTNCTRRRCGRSAARRRCTRRWPAPQRRCTAAAGAPTKPCADAQRTARSPRCRSHQKVKRGKRQRMMGFGIASTAYTPARSHQAHRRNRVHRSRQNPLLEIPPRARTDRARGLLPPEADPTWTYTRVITAWGSRRDFPVLFATPPQPADRQWEDAARYGAEDRAPRRSMLGRAADYIPRKGGVMRGRLIVSRCGRGAPR